MTGRMLLSLFAAAHITCAGASNSGQTYPPASGDRNALYLQELLTAGGKAIYTLNRAGYSDGGQAEINVESRDENTVFFTAKDLALPRWIASFSPVGHSSVTASLRYDASTARYFVSFQLSHPEGATSVTRVDAKLSDLPVTRSGTGTFRGSGAIEMYGNTWAPNVDENDHQWRTYPVTVSIGMDEQKRQAIWLVEVPDENVAFRFVFSK
jgi:hypothetical protein